jgi:sarcosine oxidase
VVESRRGWDELARLHGAPLITPTGALDFGVTRRPEVLAGELERAGLEHELLSAADASARWDIAFDTTVLWHPGAGVIDAEAGVSAMLALATALGASVHTDWPVARVERTASGYRALRADGAFVDAEQVVVAAGGWLPDLLADLALPPGFLEAFPALEVRQEQAYHFPYRDLGPGRPLGGGLGPEPGASWPSFIHKSDEIQVYGLPGGRDADWRGQKVAEYNGGKRIPSAAHHDRIVDDRNRQRVIDYVERYVPGLVPEPYAETTCLFTNTPTEDFVLDRAEGVTVLAPCSGHGAKFAPLIGELAAALVAGEDRRVPALFRPSAVPAL